MVVPAFGFSVGDFLSLIGLVSKASKALQTSDEASSQRLQAALDLKTFEGVLRRIQALEPGLENSGLVQQIRLCSHTCHAPIANFRRRIERLENQSAGSKLTACAKFDRATASIKWAFSVHEEFVRLKASIAPQLTIIDILLQLHNAENILQLRDTTTIMFKYMEQMLKRTDGFEVMAASQLGILDLLNTVKPILEELSRPQTVRVAIVDALENVDRSVEKLQQDLEAQRTIIKLVHERVGDVSRKQVTSSTKSESLPMTTTSSTLEAGEMSSNCRPSPTVPEAVAVLFRAAQSTIYEFVLLVFGLFEVLNRFTRVLITLPRPPTMLLSDNIHVEDVLGRTWSLPFQHFRYLPVIRSLLKCEFEGCLGEEAVQEECFELYQGVPLSGEAALLTGRKAEAQPQSRIFMALRLSARLFGIRCPWCWQKNADPISWIRCKECGLAYTMETNRPREARISLERLEADHIESDWRVKPLSNPVLLGRDPSRILRATFSVAPDSYYYSEELPWRGAGEQMAPNPWARI